MNAAGSWGGETVPLQMKSSLKGDEGVTNEMAGGARVEEAGLKLFTYADTEDKSGRFHKCCSSLFYLNFHELITPQEHDQGLFYFMSSLVYCEWPGGRS